MSPYRRPRSVEALPSTSLEALPSRGRGRGSGGRWSRSPTSPRDAGVGAGTVSRVLNDSPRVSDADPRPGAAPPSRTSTTDRTRSAQGLSRGRCQTLGVVVPFFTHASAVERLRGVVAALRRQPLRPRAVQRRVAGAPRRALRRPHPPRPGRRPARHVAAAAARRPRAPARAPACPSCWSTPGATGVPVGRHRRRRGRPDRHPPPGRPRPRAHRLHRRRPRQRASGSPRARKREQGYREVLRRRRASRSTRRYVRHGPHERDVGRSGSPSELLAIGATADRRLRRLRRPGHRRARGGAAPRGLRRARGPVGRRLRRHRVSAYAGLTTVRQPLFESGQLGARAAARRRSHGASRPAAEPSTDLPLELVERSTTAPPPRARRASGDG